MPILGTSSLATNGWLPSYAQGLALLNRYMPDNSVYNFKASNTRRLRAGLAQGSTGLTHHVVVGDSTSADALGGGAYDVLAMWHRQVRTRLAAAFSVPVGGTGFATTAETSPTVVSDPRWTFSGSWPNGSLYVTGSGSGTTATFSTATVGGETGRYVILHFLSTSATVTLTVDGGTPANGTVTTAVSGGTAATYNAGVITFGGTTGRVTTVTIDTGVGVNTTHTATLTPVSASNVYVIGGRIESTAGLVVHNIAQYGALATGTGGWADTSAFFNLQGVRKACVPTSPDAVWIKLGVNDLNTGVAAATVTTALATVRAYWPAADCFLIAQYQPSGTTTTNWQAYIAALYQLADTLDCALFDLTDRSGGYTVAAANGLMGDNNHPNQGAHTDTGLMVAQTLMR